MSDGQHDNEYSACYNATMIISSGVWYLMEANSHIDPTIQKPLRYNQFAFPVLLWQILLAVGLVQLVAFILKPFRFPRVVTEILVGILVGPATLGLLDDFRTMKLVFPRFSFINIAMVGELGMFFFLFLVGVQCNIRIIGRLGKKVFYLAISNLVVPFIVGMLACKAFDLKTPDGTSPYILYFYISIIPSVTAFPVLSRLVTELKFLNTETGRLALYSSIVTDMFTWIALSIVSLIPANIQALDPTKPAITQPKKLATLYMLVSTGAFMLACWFVIRPILCWYQQRLLKGVLVNDQQVVLVITSAMAMGAVLDSIGLHPLFGGFLFGLMVPKGPIADALVSRLESFTIGLFLPIYFVSAGSNVDILFVSVQTSEDHKTVRAIVLIYLIVTVVKLAGNMVIAHLFSMRLLQGLALGLLMCTKGQVEVILLSIGIDKGLYSLGMYTVMVLACLLTTITCVPVVTFLSTQTRGKYDYRRRNLQSMRLDAELRIVTCIHNIRHVPGILSLLHISQSIKQSPLFVCALHLNELVNRSVATIVIRENDIDNPGAQSMVMDCNQSLDHFNRMVTAFRSLEHNINSITVQPLTVISPYSTMHHDICKVAEGHYTTIIILPFHRMRTPSGVMQELVPAAREVNLKVLERPPCSVGILVDRGIGGNMRIETSTIGHKLHQVAILFFGGPDDREAVTYALRWTGHKAVALTLVRFIFNDEGMFPSPKRNIDEVRSGLTMIPEEEMERQLDDHCVTEFRLKSIEDETIIYTEINVQSCQDTVVSLRAMVDYHDMYIVGRRHDDNSPILSGMLEWMEFPELGCVGDFLLSSDFGALASILVIQQHIK